MPQVPRVNGLMSVSCSTTREVAAPQPPQHPQVLPDPPCGPWRPRLPGARGPPRSGPGRGRGRPERAPLQGLTPERLRQQRLRLRKMFSQPGRQHFCGRSQMFLTPLDRTHAGSFRGSGQLLSSTLNPCWTPGRGPRGCPGLPSSVRVSMPPECSWPCGGADPGGRGAPQAVQFHTKATGRPTKEWAPQCWFLVTS